MSKHSTISWRNKKAIFTWYTHLSLDARPTGNQEVAGSTPRGRLHYVKENWS